MLSSADRPNWNLLRYALLIIGGFSAASCGRWGYDLTELDLPGEGSCSDQALNGSETDIDCGGDDCESCDDDQSCRLNTDCVSRVCGDRVCQAPTCEDAVENGDEQGPDCGGSCPDCVAGAGASGGGPGTGGSGGMSAGGTGGSGALGVDVGRVGYWEFDDSMGTTATDSSGNGNDGVLMEYNAPTWGEGRTSGALRFDGFTQWVRVPNSSSLDSIQTRNQITIAAWVYRTVQYNLWSAIASQQYETGEDEHYELTFYEGALTFIVSTDQYRFGLCSDPNLGTFDEWIHVAGSFDGETLRTYMNGVEVCSLDLPGTMSPETTPLIIGGNSNFATNDAQELFAGYIDELALYNRALASSEIASLAGVN